MVLGFIFGCVWFNVSAPNLGCRVSLNATVTLVPCGCECGCAVGPTHHLRRAEQDGRDFHGAAVPWRAVHELGPAPTAGLACSVLPVSCDMHTVTMTAVDRAVMCSCSEQAARAYPSWTYSLSLGEAPGDVVLV